MKSWKTGLFCSAVAIGASLGHSAWAGMACGALTGLSVSDTTIAAATAVTSPLAVTSPAGKANISVPFCRVEGVTHPTPGADVKFEVWLPENWNGRLKTEATGGYLGGIPYPRMAEELALGYVETGSNLGHEGGQNPSWDYNHPETLAAYGYGAHPFVNKAARAVVTAFYDRPPAYSYFDGCSGGGRQALMIAERYPDLFDGIFAGAPSNFYPDVIMQILWQQRIQTPKTPGDPPLLSPAKLAMVTKAAVAACDAADGLKDNLITDPRACKFDPKVLQCKAGDAPDCLTAAQVAGVREIYRGPHRSNGQQLFTGPFPGGEFTWNMTIGDAGGYGPFIRDVVFKDPKWDWRTLDFNTQYETVRDKLYPLTGAPSPDFSGFKAHHGKLLQYHGWGDAVVAPSVSPNFYNALIAYEKLKGQPGLDQAIEKLTPQQIAAEATEGQAVQDYYRLFMVPGMGHCGGGDGPNSFDQSPNAPSPTLDAQHSAFKALELWVEQGVPPERIVATQYVKNDPKQGIARQRPLCAYPKVAAYKGTGDINDAGNFFCALPDPKTLTPTAGDMVEIRNALKMRTLLSAKAQ